VTLNYSVKAEKEKKKLNKFALINCIIGFPTIAFLGLLIGKGFLDNHLILAYCSIGVLSLGMIYSIFKLVKR
jgi:hypothetical protein